MCDNIDNCPAISNTDQGNVDGDLVGDVCDVEQCDGMDHDGDTDAYNGFLTPGEVCTAGTNIGTVNNSCECFCDDSDNDGVCDDIDICE